MENAIRGNRCIGFACVQCRRPLAAFRHGQRQGVVSVGGRLQHVQRGGAGGHGDGFIEQAFRDAFHTEGDLNFDKFIESSVRENISFLDKLNIWS